MKRAHQHFSTKPGRRWLNEWAARPSSGCTGYDDLNDAWSELPGVALQPIDEAGDGRSSFKRRYEAILGMVAVED